MYEGPKTPGGGKFDSVFEFPMMLHEGEEVVPNPQSGRYRDLLRKLAED